MNSTATPSPSPRSRCNQKLAERNGWTNLTMNNGELRGALPNGKQQAVHDYMAFLSDEQRKRMLEEV